MKPRTVIARDAASLVILRGRGEAAEVLLGRREPRHRFMPNVFVFPGGRVDAADARAALASGLEPRVAAKLEARWPAGKARALAVAAVRETFEETGLAFGRMEDGALRPALHHLDYVARAITPPGSPIRFHARFFLADGEAAEGRLDGNGELLDLRWVPLARALDLPLVDVTEFVLQEIGRRVRGWEPPGVPFFHYRRGAARVRYE